VELEPEKEEAKVHKCTLTVSHVDSKLAVAADRELLLSAVGNLLQNAFKFIHPGSEVLLKTYSLSDRILIEVEDKCGGLPPGDLEKMFLPFTQGGIDRSGLGLGLSISRRGIEANKGTLGVRNVPGSGCVFTVDLPRFVMPEQKS
jgi:signal transduction histidine kinase